MAASPAHWLRSVGDGVPVSSIAAVQRQWSTEPQQAPPLSATDAEASSQQCPGAAWWELLHDGCDDALSDALFVATTPLILYAAPVNAIGLTVVSRSNHSLQTAYNLSEAAVGGGFAAAPALAVQLVQNATLGSAQLYLYLAFSYAPLIVNRYLYDAGSDSFQLLTSYKVQVDEVDSIRMLLDVGSQALYLLPGEHVYRLDIATGHSGRVVIPSNWPEDSPSALALNPQLGILYVEQQSKGRVILHNVSSGLDTGYYALPASVTAADTVIYSMLFEPQLNVLFVSATDASANARLLVLDCASNGSVVIDAALSLSLTASALLAFPTARPSAAAAASFDLYAADTRNDELVHVTGSLHDAASTPSAPPLVLDAFILGPAPTLQLMYSVALDQQSGVVYVNPDTDIIKTLTADGQPRLSPSFPTYMHPLGVGMSASALAVDGQHRLYAANFDDASITQYSSDGERTAVFSSFQNPQVLCADQTRPVLYMADLLWRNCSVWMLDTSADGRVLQRFSAPDSAPWQPMGLALDTEQQHLYVNDPNNARVLVLSVAQGGQLVSTFALQTGLGFPQAGIALAASRGILFVTDPSGGRVVVMDSKNGSVVGEITAPAGQTALIPTGVAVSQQGVVYVVDPINACVAMFQLNDRSDARLPQPLSTEETVATIV